jgi:SAM-dependent methyltransferase
MNTTSGLSTNTLMCFLRKFYWNLHSYTWDEFLDSTDYSTEIDDIVQIAEKHKTTNHPTLLDQGCATGSYSIAFSKRNYTVTGIDYAPKMVRKAKMNANIHDLNNISFLISDYNKGLDFKSTHFDFVLSAHTNLDINNNSDIIREIKRVLKNDGILLVVVKRINPKKVSMVIDNKIFLRLFLWLIKSTFFSGHRKRLIDIRKIQTQIESMGFAVICKADTIYNNVLLFKKNLTLEQKNSHA